MEKQKLQVPLSERLKSIPGFFGVHLAEKPKFNLLKKEGNFELREYQPMLIAKTRVRGSYDRVKENAFLKLAAYIFGKNHGEVKMPMTTPVFLETQSADKSELTMSFVLPSSYSGRSAPIPDDSTVHIQEIVAQTWGVVKYSGHNNPDEIGDKSRDLQSWLKINGYDLENQPVRVAQYDGPHTIPLLRLNEVQIQLWSDRIH